MTGLIHVTLSRDDVRHILTAFSHVPRDDPRYPVWMRTRNMIDDLWQYRVGGPTERPGTLTAGASWRGRPPGKVARRLRRILVAAFGPDPIPNSEENP